MSMAERQQARTRLDTTLWLASAAYATILVIAGVQLALQPDPGTAARAAAPYALALLSLLGVGTRPGIAVDGSMAERWIEGVAAAGSALSVWLVIRFLAALPEGIGTASGYYRVKVEVTSPVGDHNTAAGLLLVAVVAAAITVSRRRRGWLWLAVTSLGLVATLSRGAAIVLLAAAAAAWLTASRRRIAVAVTGAAATTTVAILSLAALLGAAAPAGSAIPEGPVGASVVGRVDLAVRGVEVAGSEPLLGAGFGSFAAHASDLPPPNDHAHQLVAHAAAEAGVIAGVAVVVLALLLVFGAWGLPRSPLRDLTLVGGGALLAHAQVDVLGGLPAYEVLVAILLALIVRGRVGPGRSTPPAPPS